MRLLLDENVTPEIYRILKSNDIDVESVHSLKLLSINDNDLFSFAQKEKRVLVTHNGIHFIDKIPPRVNGVFHSGLIWLRSQVTRGNAVKAGSELVKFAKKYLSINGEIWALKKDQEGNFSIYRKYP